MSNENRFVNAVHKEIPGIKYRQKEGDAVFSHPSLNELGRMAHAHWFGFGFRGMLSRRAQLIEIANELLRHLEAPRLYGLTPGVESVDPALVEYAEKLTQDPLSGTAYLMGQALRNALQIINANEKLEYLHHLGGSVYGPLMILEGVLMEPRTRQAKTEPRWPADDVVIADHAAYVASNNGSELHWLKYASKKYHVSYDHAGRRWREIKKTA